MGAYAEKVNTENRGISAAAIRQSKNERSKNRSEDERKFRREEGQERQKAWDKLSIKQKIASLKGRRGNSKKQLTRLQESK